MVRFCSISFLQLLSGFRLVKIIWNNLKGARWCSSEVFFAPLHFSFDPVMHQFCSFRQHVGLKSDKNVFYFLFFPADPYKFKEDNNCFLFSLVNPCGIRPVKITQNPIGAFGGIHCETAMGHVSASKISTILSCVVTCLTTSNVLFST